MATLKRTVEKAILAGVPAGLRRTGLTVDQISTAMVNGVVSQTPSKKFKTSWAVSTNYRRAEIDGERIRQTDVKLLFQIPPGETEPNPDDDFTVALDGRRLRVENLEQVKPGSDETVLFIAQLRR